MNDNARKILEELYEGGLTKKTVRDIRRWFFGDFHRTRKDNALWKIWDRLVLRDTAAVDQKTRERFIALCERLGLPVSEKTVERSLWRFSRKALRRVVSVAAVVLLMIGVGVYINLNRPETTLAAIARIEKNHAGEAPRLISLPCGSEIWIQGESTLEIMNTQREMNLYGEACFSVRQTGEPFIIHTEHADITVLGTIFNVRNIESISEFAVELFDGTVSMHIGDEEFKLTEGNRLVIDKNSGTWGVEPMPANTGYPEWVQAAALASGGITFDDILLAISKSNGMELVNNRPDLGSDRYLFILTEDMDIDEALGTLQLLNNNFSYRVEGDKLIIE